MRSGAVQLPEEYVEGHICYAVFQKTGPRQSKTTLIFNLLAATAETG
jgi:hypothetical protein